MSARALRVAGEMDDVNWLGRGSHAYLARLQHLPLRQPWASAARYTGQDRWIRPGSSLLDQSPSIEACDCQSCAYGIIAAGTGRLVVGSFLENALARGNRER